MPIFEFQCRACNAQFEKLLLPGERRVPQCPHCHSSRVRKLMFAGSVRPHGIPLGSGGFKPPACARKSS